MAVSAVIAAAGLSARMRDFKPLLSLGNSTVIRHSVDAFRAAGVDYILVVTGYQSAVLERHLFSSGIMFLNNERFAQTDMLASVQMGLSALPADGGGERTGAAVNLAISFCALMALNGMERHERSRK